MENLIKDCLIFFLNVCFCFGFQHTKRNICVTKYQYNENLKKHEMLTSVANPFEAMYRQDILYVNATQHTHT